MKKLFPLFLVILFVSCSSAKKSQSSSSSSTNAPITVAGPSGTSVESSEAKDGSSYEKAIVIKAKNEMEGVAAEYKWLKENYPGYKTKGQTLSSKGSRHYDILKITTKDGEEKTIYFDITNFFGKF